MYHIRITHQSESRQEAENRDKVERIEYMGPYPHLQMLNPFSDTSSDFSFIMRRLICQEVCPVVEHFLLPVVDGANYSKFFTAVASGLVITVNSRITVIAGELFSTVLDLSPMRRLPVVLGLRFGAGIEAFFDDLDEYEYRFISLLLRLLW